MKVYAERYTNRHNELMLKITGKQEDLEQLGFEAFDGPNRTTGNCYLRMPFDEDVVTRVNVYNEKLRDVVRRKHMRDFIDEPDALLFYTTIANTKVGTRGKHSAGVRLLSVRWDALQGMMMRDGWMEVGTHLLTEFGVREAIMMRDWMEGASRRRGG